MRGTTCIICLFMLLVAGCREGNSQKSQAAGASKTKEQEVADSLLTTDQPPAKAVWTPPANPDPQQILSDAQADATAGRYEEALAKHVWFHHHALEIDLAFYGVRLSFALGYWKDLAKVYPPAKAKLIELRDEAEKKIGSGQDGIESFTDFEAINSELGEDKRTVDVFKALDVDNSGVARELFDRARPVLLRAGEAKLSSKYVDRKDYADQVEKHKQLISREDNSEFAEEHTEFARKYFANEVSTLVALLVLSDRKTEAETIAADAKKVWADKVFAEALGKALEGKVPEPWPPAMN